MARKWALSAPQSHEHRRAGITGLEAGSLPAWWLRPDSRRLHLSQIHRQHVIAHRAWCPLGGEVAFADPAAQRGFGPAEAAGGVSNWCDFPPYR
jgi:hypothetical protein